MGIPSPLVSTSWLAEHLDDPNVKLLDASWHLPTANRDAWAEFDAQHIPGAQFYDIDGIAAPGTDLPHMAASPERFAEMVGALGISETDTIVIYDSVGLFSAARAWWNFRIMGASETFVLDGGLPKWLAEGRPVSSKIETPDPTSFTPAPVAGGIVTAEEVLDLLGNGDAQVVDVRPAGRFSGEVAEPRPGLRGGHMPGASSLPFMELIADGSLASDEAIIAAFDKAGVDPNEPIVSSCGSGVTAPLVNLALAKIGVEALRVYDGSWAEWGAREYLPVVKD